MRFKPPHGSEKAPPLHQSQKACVCPHDLQSTPVSMAEHLPQNISFHTDNRAVLSPCKIQNITSASVTRTMVPTPRAEHPSLPACHRTPISTTSTGHPGLHTNQRCFATLREEHQCQETNQRAQLLPHQGRAPVFPEHHSYHTSVTRTPVLPHQPLSTPKPYLPPPAECRSRRH